MSIVCILMQPLIAPLHAQQRDLVPVPPTAAKPASVTVPRGFALIIGISQYTHLGGPQQLAFPASDADAIYRILISQQGGAFPAENVHRLTNDQATLEAITRELEVWLPSVSTPADRVVVYFAGHGFVQRGKGYLAPADVDPARLEATAYPMQRIGEVLSTKVKARWKVLLTDACHSDKITVETTNEALDSQFGSLPGDFLTLTASTERESSYEDPKLGTGAGVFSYFLMQAWQGNADSEPCDGRITADELVEYVRTNVRRYAKERHLSQTPTARGDYDPDMLLGVAKECLPPPHAATRGTAIIEVNVDDAVLYVDDQLVGPVSKNKPLVLPGLSSGPHSFRLVKTGYEDAIKQIMIVPAQETAVTLVIRYPRQIIKKSAADLNAAGERLLFTQRSTISLANLSPVQRTQSESDLKKARELFTRALADAPTFKQAAVNLGQVNQLLGDQNGSLLAYRRAIEIDAVDVQARSQYAAVLIESGDADAAIRQLTEAQRLDARNDQLFSLMARAYWDKGAWARAVESADQAIALNASNAQAYLWRADAYRQLAATEQEKVQRTSLYEHARDDYHSFVTLTTIATPVHAWLAFHLIGFGAGSVHHADRRVSYDNLRNAGYLGLCLTEEKVGNPLKARTYCERAAQYDAADPITLFILGNVNRDLFNRYKSCDYLGAARTSYQRMLAINRDLDESAHARDYLAQIDNLARQMHCRL